MSGRILIVATIALVSYVIIPALAGAIARARIKRLVRRLAAGTGEEGTFEDAKLNSVTITRDNGAIEAIQRESRLDSRETRFFTFDAEKGPSKIRWKGVTLCRRGAAILYIPGKNALKRAICVFHAERDRQSLAQAAAALLKNRDWHPEAGPGAIKPYSVAVGMFLEFLMLIEALGHDGMALVAIAALIGVCGKALPYLPPGVLFAVIGAKKNRRHNAVGFLLMALGTALNIGLLFLVIVRLGFVLP